MAARIEAAVAKELPTYARARDLEDDTKTMCFEEPKARRLLRIELGRAPSTIWMVAFNYDERPTRSELLDRAAPNHKLRSVADENVVDAQIGYEFQDGPLEGLSILAQANNLTDEPFKTFENGDERRTIDYQSYGRTFAVGVNYRF